MIAPVLLENTSASIRMPLHSPFMTTPVITFTRLAPASQEMPFVGFREEAVPIARDYLTTRQALIAIAEAFKHYIAYSSQYDAYLMGQLSETEFSDVLKEFSCYPTSDEAALSDRVEIVLRESGLELYPDELATMFNVPEDQIDRVLDGLAKSGLVVQNDGS